MNSNAIQDENDVLQQVSTETLSSWFFSQNLPEELDTVPTTVENTHLDSTNLISKSSPSITHSFSSFFSIFQQTNLVENLSLISTLAVFIVFLLVTIYAIMFTYRRHQQIEDEKHREEYKKRKWVKRQSSRYSIDLDRFVADIVGPDGELQVNQKVQELKIPTKPKLHSNQTLNPLAVSIIDLLARNYQCDHISEHNHNEPLPNSAMQSLHLSHADVKLKAVKEDDEDVLFDERSLSRQGSNASECTVETMASVTASIDEEPHLHQQPNIENRFMFPLNDDSSTNHITNDFEETFKLDFNFKDSNTNVEHTDL